MSFENQIRIRPLDDVDESVVDSLGGRYIFVENDGVKNAGYNIKSAYVDGTDIVLNLGNTTLIRDLLDADDLTKGYVYNIDRRQDCVIPLSYSHEEKPEFYGVTDKTVNAGSSIEFTVNA